MSPHDDVIDTWTRVDKVDLNKHPSEWTKDQGKPLDATDVDIITSTTAEELQAVGRHLQERALVSQISLSVTEQLRDLMLPYFDRHPDCRTVEDVWPHMTAEDRATAKELFSAMRATKEDSR